jgi:hypothetical protein
MEGCMEHYISQPPWAEPTRCHARCRVHVVQPAQQKPHCARVPDLAQGGRPGGRAGPGAGRGAAQPAQGARQGAAAQEGGRARRAQPRATAGGLRAAGRGQPGVRGAEVRPIDSSPRRRPLSEQAQSDSTCATWKRPMRLPVPWPVLPPCRTPEYLPESNQLPRCCPSNAALQTPQSASRFVLA